MRRLMVGGAVALATAALVAGPVDAQVSTTTTAAGGTTTTAVGGVTTTTLAVGGTVDSTLPTTGAPLILGAGAGMGAIALGSLGRLLRRR